jgi:hypothetical protein
MICTVMEVWKGGLYASPQELLSCELLAILTAVFNVLSSQGPAILTLVTLLLISPWGLHCTIMLLIDGFFYMFHLDLPDLALLPTSPCNI